MIYIDDHIWDFDLEESLAAVSAERRHYALRYRHERDQRLCVAAYRLLERALQLEFGITQVPPFINDANGKPRLDSFPDVHFNLSHCDGAVACAVSTSPVGIDVECFDHYDPEVVAATMSDEECALIAVSQQPAVEFARLWTIKESLYKLNGENLAHDLRSMLANTSNYRFYTTIYPDFVCTTCQLKTKD